MNGVQGCESSVRLQDANITGLTVTPGCGSLLQVHRASLQYHSRIIVKVRSGRSTASSVIKIAFRQNGQE